MAWILEHLSDSWLWDVPKKSERCFWLEKWTAEVRTVLLAGVLGQADVAVFQYKNMVIQEFPQHAQNFALHVTTHRPRKLSFALAMVHTTNARRFQKTHPSREMESALNASKDITMGVADLAPTVKQIQRLTQRVLQWLAQLAHAYLKLALIARTDLLTCATLATHDSCSL